MPFSIINFVQCFISPYSMPHGYVRYEMLRAVANFSHLVAPILSQHLSRKEVRMEGTMRRWPGFCFSCPGKKKSQQWEVSAEGLTLTCAGGQDTWDLREKRGTASCFDLFLSTLTPLGIGIPVQFKTYKPGPTKPEIKFEQLKKEKETKP